MGFFDIFKSKNNSNNLDMYLSGFSKTNNTLGKKLKFLLDKNPNNNSDFVEELMVTLIEADIGYNTAKIICDKFLSTCKDINKSTANELMEILINVLKEIYGTCEDNVVISNSGTTVILLVGVNGSGKTSTCAKLANKFIKQNKSVALVAGDTFRAGASEQLQEWAERLNINCIVGKENQDPSSVLVDGCRFAKENNIDILICDTAGRLQNKTNLMKELEKMFKVVSKEIDGAPHNAWLVLDSNTGQNGISQAELFNGIAKLNGVVLTKVDGTSKGGIVLAIKNVTGLPVKYVTFGEGLDEISEFNIDSYLYSILGDLKYAS